MVNDTTNVLFLNIHSIVIKNGLWLDKTCTLIDLTASAINRLMEIMSFVLHLLQGFIAMNFLDERDIMKELSKFLAKKKLQSISDIQ